MELKYTTLEDITMSQFSKVMEIFSDLEQPRYEKELQIVQLILPEMSEDDILDLPLEWIDRQIDLIVNVSDGELFPSITINGQEFTLKGDHNDFKLSYGQFRSFVRSVQNKDVDYLPNYMSKIYVNDTTTPEERVALFTEHMTMNYVIKPLMVLNRTVSERTGL